MLQGFWGSWSCSIISESCCRDWTRQTERTMTSPTFVTSARAAVPNPWAVDWYWAVGHLVPERINNLPLLYFIYYLKLNNQKLPDSLCYIRLWFNIDTRFFLLYLENTSFQAGHIMFLCFIYPKQASPWNYCLKLLRRAKKVGDCWFRASRVGKKEKNKNRCVYIFLFVQSDKDLNSVDSFFRTAEEEIHPRFSHWDTAKYKIETLGL